MVALAIEEADAVMWEMSVDWKHQTVSDVLELLEGDRGPGTPGFAYEVVWLDKEGRVVEDFSASDVEEAKSHFLWPGARWESLSTDADVAKAFVSQRLAAAPYDRQ